MDQTLGMNRTGIDMSPIHTKKMLKVEEDIPRTTDGDTTMAAIEDFFLENAEPLGSIPLPGTVKGALKSTAKMMTGKHPEVFINKLGERLAYERSGARIYEQLIAKCQHISNELDTDIHIPIERLIEFRNQEVEHFEMLKQCLEILGADPTAQTPDADGSGVASSGLMKVIMDPRTSVSQSLQAMLTLELADNAAWELLINLAGDMGMTDMVEKFKHALMQEDTHLSNVREWYDQSIRMQTKGLA